MEMQIKDRQAAVAGSFYPASESKLKLEVQNYFKEVDHVLVEPKTRALILPHAGYVFSGAVAAAGVSCISKNKEIDTVVLIGSSHQFAFDGVSINPCANYITPLGKVEVNQELALDLIKSDDMITYRSEAHESEHCLEVQLPFLQEYLEKEFRILPIIIGTRSKKDCKHLASLLKPYFTENNLFLVSTDFSHYPNEKDARMVDELTMKSILKNSTDELVETLHMNQLERIDNLSTSLCGWSSVYTLLALTEKMKSIHIQNVMYRNSADSPYGDKEKVVGYNSICFSDKI